MPPPKPPTDSRFTIPEDNPEPGVDPRVGGAVPARSSTHLDQTIRHALQNFLREDDRHPETPEAPEAPAPAPAPPTSTPESDYLPARMVNEFVYCARLFYYEHVEGVFVENADTARGAAQHKRVDNGRGDLPAAQDDHAAIATDDGEPEKLHSRSIQLGSDRLGAVCKMDLIESIAGEDLFSARKVTPVEYKSGAPRDGEDGPVMWDADRIQLALQCFVLRDNGYDCTQGVLYYRQTRQRVPLDVTPELEAWTLDTLARAREAMRGPIPPPLVDSPKCIRCSLAPVCLPDETRALREGPHPEPPVRRIIAPRDDRRALYLNTPGLFVGRSGEVLTIKDKKTIVQEVRIKDVSHLGVFGNIQVSTQTIQALCEQDVPVAWFSGGGWFYGLTRAQSLTNVFTRIEQFRHASDKAACLLFARQFVRGKIRNQRTMLRRNHLQPPEPVLNRLRCAAEDAAKAESIESLLGIEGAAAAEYFAAFAGMLRTEEGESTGVTFDFAKRNRRPPRDPVNALLSLAYSLLAKDCMVAAHAVGFDPAVGFLHQPRFGRPALALDIMEEFRPIVADSAVLTAINNRMLGKQDFVTAGDAVNLAKKGRATLFEAYESRMTGIVTHPVFGYKVCYRRAIELQFRMLARRLTGEIAEYVPFMTR